MRQAGKSESVLHPPLLYQGWTAFSLQTCLHLNLGPSPDTKHSCEEPGRSCKNVQSCYYPRMSLPSCHSSRPHELLPCLGRDCGT